MARALTWLRSIARRALDRLARELNSLARRIYLSEPEKRVLAWNAAGGDKAFRYQYDLDATSTVVDAGGFDGQWASDLLAMYGCTMHIFEPIPPFADAIRRRFQKNSKVVVHAAGLAGTAREVTMTLDDVESSALRAGTGAKTTRAQLVSAVPYFESLRIEKVDLLKVNIEGGEYELLEHLIQSEWTAKIRNLQIQFHDFVPDCDARRSAIRAALLKTHEEVYCFPYIRESWKHRGESARS